LTRSGQIVDILAGAGALLAAFLGCAIMWGVLRARISMFPPGTGGVGAVSVGFPETVLRLIASVVVNRLLARPAHGSLGLVSRLHRAHSVTVVAVVVFPALLILILTVSIVPAMAVLTAFVLVGTLLAAQFLLLAALLVAFVRERRRDVTAI
jgi:hypothetical protein